MKNQKGFTLVEMIIAIGILMIASGFILQIFMTAKTMNIRAHAVDQSVSLGTSFVETVKASDQPLEGGLSAAYPSIEQRKGEKGEQYFKQYYDQNWQILESSQQEKAQYYMEAQLKPEQEGALLGIHLAFMEIKKDKSERSIYTLEAAKIIKEGSAHE